MNHLEGTVIDQDYACVGFALTRWLCVEISRSIVQDVLWIKLCAHAATERRFTFGRIVWMFATASFLAGN